MGKIGDFFDKLFAPSSDDFTDGAFNRRMKRWQKEYGQDNMEKLLPLAYEDRSVKSAFWWYEHLPEKPDMTDYKWAVRASVKYLISFGGPTLYIKRNLGVLGEEKKAYIKLFLPDINYRKIQVTNASSNTSYSLIDKDATANRLEMNYKEKYPFASPIFWVVAHSGTLEGTVDVAANNNQSASDAIAWQSLITNICNNLDKAAEADGPYSHYVITWDMVEEEIKRVEKDEFLRKMYESPTPKLEF